MKRRNLSKNDGFALLELVAVVVILMLLATFAVPRFASLETGVRSTSVEAFAGRVRSAAAVSHALWLAQGQPESIEMNSAAISLVNGYPDLSTIDDALPGLGEFVYDPAAGLFTGNDTPASCSVRYREAVSVGSVPVVTVDTTGC